MAEPLMRRHNPGTGQVSEHAERSIQMIARRRPQWHPPEGMNTASVSPEAFCAAQVGSKIQLLPCPLASSDRARCRSDRRRRRGEDTGSDAAIIPSG
jgi:hypothetical protein